MGRPRTVATTLAGVVVTGLAVAPIVEHWLTNPADQRMVDLDVYRTGGQAVLTGRPVYDVVTEAPQMLPFTYPPFAALLAAPLGMLSWPAAQWLWTAAVFAALAVVVCFSFRSLLGRAGWWAPLLAGVLTGLCAHLLPVSDQIRFGQVDVFLVALCIADCAARSPRWPRGLLVGLATAIKLVPGVFIVYFLITGRRREAGVATLTAVVVTLATFVVLPGDSADFWFRAIFDSERLGSNTGTQNQSMRGMLLRLGGSETLMSLVWLGCVAVVAWAGFRAARRASLAGSEITGVAITGLLAVLLSPVAWIHHLAWVVVALGALTGAARDSEGGRGGGRVAVAACVWLLYFYPVPWWAVRTFSGGPVRWVTESSYGLGALALLWILGVWLLRRENPYCNRADTKRGASLLGTLKP